MSIRKAYMPILNYQKATKASERKITAALGISKSEVHRSLLIARLPKKIKESAKAHDTEKYVLLEFDAMEAGPLKKQVEKKILSGEMTKRSELKRTLRSGNAVNPGRKTRKQPTLPKGLTANAFLKAMKSKSKRMDPETQKALEKLLEETKELVNI